ncbi:MAG: gas vesicle protein [Nocardioidaceae bacterium]
MAEDGKPGIAEVSREAKRQLAELVGRPVEGVTSVGRTEDGWTLHLEVLELKRVPETTDVIGSYMVKVDHDGTVEGHQRVQRYTRAQTEEV